jgi:hypothetical protein
MFRIITNVFAFLFRIKGDFTYLFFRREGKELAGRYLKNLWILSGIVVLTFLAIGFSTGSLNYLDLKMNDPFIRWVTIPVSLKNEDSIAVIKNKLLEPAIKDSFKYESVSGYYKFPLLFKNLKKHTQSRRMGRTVDFSSSLNKAIFLPKNSPSPNSRYFINEFDIGIIVTQSFLDSLYYPRDASHILMAYNRNDDPNCYIPLPIIGVVRELPDLCEFATTPYFEFLLNKDDKRIFPFNPEHTRQLMIYVRGDKKNALNFKEKLKTFALRDTGINIYLPLFSSPEKDSSSFIAGYQVTVSFQNDPGNVSIIDRMYKKIEASTDFKEFKYSRFM